MSVTPVSNPVCPTPLPSPPVLSTLLLFSCRSYEVLERERRGGSHRLPLRHIHNAVPSSSVPHTKICYHCFGKVLLISPICHKRLPLPCFHGESAMVVTLPVTWAATTSCHCPSTFLPSHCLPALPSVTTSSVRIEMPAFPSPALV